MFERISFFFLQLSTFLLCKVGRSAWPETWAWAMQWACQKKTQNKQRIETNTLSVENLDPMDVLRNDPSFWPRMSLYTISMVYLYILDRNSVLNLSRIKCDSRRFLLLIKCWCFCLLYSQIFSWVSCFSRIVGSSRGSRAHARTQSLRGPCIRWRKQRTDCFTKRPSLGGWWWQWKMKLDRIIISVDVKKENKKRQWYIVASVRLSFCCFVANCDSLKSTKAKKGQLTLDVPSSSSEPSFDRRNEENAR